MTKINEKPDIRFAGFTDPWEQRKLGEMASSTFGGGTPATSNEGYWNGSIPWIQSSDLIENALSGVIPRKHISKEGLIKSATKLVPENSIAIITRVGVGKLAFMPFSYTTSQDFLSLSRLNIDPWFGVYSCYKKLQSELHEVQGTSIKGITKDELLEKSISVPGMNEQKQIGKFFSNLDNLITLHQRKYEKLKNVKKSCLEKMFLKDGEKAPKLRFAGFTDPWEQRELGDYAKFRRGSFPQPYGNKEWYDGEDAMPFVQVVDVTDRLELVDNTKQKISKVAQSMSVYVSKGKILVTLQGSIGRVAITQYDAFVDRTILIFEDFNEITDKYFWAYTIQQKFDIEKQIAPGGTIKTITKEALSSFTILIPKIEEQTQIGIFFKTLDNLITLHQRELEKLKNIKKSLLEKMFA